MIVKPTTQDALSNKHQNSRITIGSEVYETVDHYYHSQKFTSLYWSNIIKKSKGEDVELYGRKPRSDFRSSWEVMETGLRAKFEQNSVARSCLLATSFQEILYEHPDPFWGTINGEGQNMIGKILMAIRKDLTDLPVCKTFKEKGSCPKGVTCRWKHGPVTSYYVPKPEPEPGICHLETLPQETLGLIFSFLDNHRKMLMRSCCKKFESKLKQWSPARPDLRLDLLDADSDDQKAFSNAFSDPYYFPVRQGILSRDPHPGLCLRIAPDDQPFLFTLIPLTTRKFSIDFGVPSLRHFAGQNIDYCLVDVNNWGVSPPTKEERTKIDFDRNSYQYWNGGYCYNGKAQLHMYDGTFKSAEDIEEGDCLMSPSGRPTFVKTIRRTDVFGNFSMINMGDFFITKGHPVFVNGDWYRPDELYEPKSIYVDSIYNYHLQPETEMIVGENNPIICAGFGSHCPRLAELDPISDALYGTGYMTKRAERYSWLMGLRERIPDELVEEMTDKYWASVAFRREQCMKESGLVH